MSPVKREAPPFRAGEEVTKETKLDKQLKILGFVHTVTLARMEYARETATRISNRLGLVNSPGVRFLAPSRKSIRQMPEVRHLPKSWFSKQWVRCKNLARTGGYIAHAHVINDRRTVEGEICLPIVTVLAGRARDLGALVGHEVVHFAVAGEKDVSGKDGRGHTPAFWALASYAMQHDHKRYLHRLYKGRPL